MWPSPAPRFRYISGYRLKELPGEDPIVVVGQDVLLASPAHGLPLGGGQGHQAQGRVGDGLRALRRDGQAAAALRHKITPFTRWRGSPAGRPSCSRIACWG